MTRQWATWLFRIAALYDGVLGLAFLFFWRDVFRFFDVTPPNHGGYVQFPALLLIIFAALFLQIARDPVRNRDLIVYGIALKIAYSGTVFWYQATTGVPSMWIWFAWLDLAFLVLFVVAHRSLRSQPA
jgi:hypothetical protein